MKIEGINLCSEVKTLNFEKNGQSFTLKFTALPLGFMEKVINMLPAPVPPKKGYCRDDSRKGAIIKDSLGRPIPFYDENDPEYISQTALINKLQTMAMLFKSLENEPKITFDTKRVDCENDYAFYKKIYEEFCNSGFSTGEFSKMINFVLKISALDSVDVEKEKEAFLSRES